MIRVSFIGGQYRDIEEPDSLHRDGEFLSFQRGEQTLLSANVANVLAIEPVVEKTSHTLDRGDLFTRWAWSYQFPRKDP